MLCACAGALPLGPVPHMVRGQLGGGFAQHAMVGQAFRQCIACSGTVVDAYRAQGWPFVLAALQARPLAHLAPSHVASGQLQGA